MSAIALDLLEAIDTDTKQELISTTSNLEDRKLSVDQDSHIEMTIYDQNLRNNIATHMYSYIPYIVKLGPERS